MRKIVAAQMRLELVDPKRSRGGVSDPFCDVRPSGRLRVITVLYDEDCGFCRWSADKLRAWDTQHRLTFAAIQSARGAELLVAVPEAHRLDSMHAVTRDGRGGRAAKPSG